MYGGYPKTPDAILINPILVNSRPVNWIESKALFGDPKSHQEYALKQFRPYCNRYGPGLVIYWFNFVDELQEEANEDGYMIMNDFPTDIVKLQMEEEVLMSPQESQPIFSSDFNQPSLTSQKKKK